MKPEWKKYTGSDEQIAEMYFAEDGFVAKNINSVSSVMSVKFNQLFIQGQKEPYLPGLFGNSLENFLSYNNTIEYLICEPHPYADMICQWTRTGQPVYWRIKGTKCPPESDGITCGIAGDLTLIAEVIDSDQYEVSFTPFEEEV
jgi:hypothetical protein